MALSEMKQLFGQAYCGYYYYYYYCYYYYLLNVLTLLTFLHTYYLITYLRTAVELSLVGSSPYTSRDKTDKNKYTKRNNTKTQYKQYKTQ